MNTGEWLFKSCLICVLGLMFEWKGFRGWVRVCVHRDFSLVCEIVLVMFMNGLIILKL